MSVQRASIGKVELLLQENAKKVRTLKKSVDSLQEKKRLASQELDDLKVSVLQVRSTLISYNV